MMPSYPWSAIVGQQALKQALLLCAIDPAIGGVLVSGPRGVAKTTLARALSELVTGRFVELPLGASEERVTGTLDLDSVLREGTTRFSPGLLARAHEGVLYVDEVNLLPDGLVDLLLDAAASGKNTVERDGVSHVHPARFVLIGTMNPEEGALRPQLLDRFGLSAVADGALSPEERAEIITRRLAFDFDPESFVARFRDEQRVLVERCQRARERARQIPLAGAGLARVTELCHAAGVEGVRADLAMLRAARAHAAWHERNEISAADVDAVAELALAHRRKAPPEPPKPSGGSQSSGGRGTESTSSGRSTPPGGASANGSTGGEGARGALPPVPVDALPVSALPAWLAEARGTQASPRRASSLRVHGGTRARGRTHERGSIAWFATLAAARGLHATPRRLTRADLRYRKPRAAPSQLWVVALDCSSSMLRAGALAAAKGVTHALEAQAAELGASFALLSFRGPSARTEATSSAGRGEFTRALASLGAGGGTPLRAALGEALAACGRPSVRARSIPKRLFLLTDGRTSERVHDVALRPELDVTVIDCERARVRLGRARTLASDLSAAYVHVDGLLGGRE